MNHLFRGGPEPTCLAAADANADGGVDIADPVYTLVWLFVGGRDLPEPFGDCGSDPTVDWSKCAAHAPCDR